MCKNFAETGHCRYGPRCRFAHGPRELVKGSVTNCFRKRKCNSYWEHGFCSYGTRCQFAHEDSVWESKLVLLGVNSILDISSRHTQGRLFKFLTGWQHMISLKIYLSNKRNKSCNFEKWILFMNLLFWMLIYFMRLSRSSIDAELQASKHYGQEASLLSRFEIIVSKQQEVIQSLQSEVLLLKSYISL